MCRYSPQQPAPRMPDIVRSQIRPVRAHHRLGRRAIRSKPVVERAADPVILEVPAGGDDLALDDVAAHALGLAQVRRAPRQEQSLQVVRVPPGRRGQDLQREVPAARGAAGVVRGATGRAPAGVSSVVDYGERASPERPACEIESALPPAVHDGERASPVPQRRWLRGLPSRRHRAHERVGGTPDPPCRFRRLSRSGRALCPQVLTRHVHHGVHQYSPSADVRFAERNALAVAQEPGGQGVTGRRVVVEVRDAQRHPEFPAVAAQAPAGGRARSPPRRSGSLRGRGPGAHVRVEVVELRSRS